MPFITPTWNEAEGYVGDSPLAEGSGWSYDENKGWYKWVPSTSPTLDTQSIQNLTPYTINYDTAPGESRFETNTGQAAATDPNAYYSQLSSDLASRIHENIASNSGDRNTQYTELLNSIKDVNPVAYYNAQIQLLASDLGHASAMGESAREAKDREQLNALLPEAFKAGVTPTQANSVANSSFSTGANLGQLIKSQAEGSSSFWKDNLIGTAKIMAMAFGAAGADAALGTGAGALDSSAIAAGGSGGGGAFVPTAGSSFAIAPEAAYTTAGLASNTAPYAGDAQYEAQDVMQQARDTNVPSGSPTSWDTGTTVFPTTGLTDAAKLAKALTSSAGSKLSGAAQNLAIGQTGMGAEIPGIIRGNQNPWLAQGQQQPIQNTKQAQLAKLLQQG